MIPVVAIIDLGKTNKKLFLFDQSYRIVYEKTARFFETLDEDGFPCENLESIRSSVFESLNEVLKLPEFDVRAVNFSAYGASFVYVDDKGQPLTPLYNYLKPYPALLSTALYDRHGGKEKFSLETSSPILGSLNSGLQLYRLKQEQPGVFDKIRFALHLPQFLGFLLTGVGFSETSSIGCHTALWDFNKNAYHEWVHSEGIANKLPATKAFYDTIRVTYLEKVLDVGIGLHDSSAAIIPYLISFKEAFVVISTGTWCISLNPFNLSSLTLAELKNDCLNFLSHDGRRVKASRLFMGQEYEAQTKRIAAHFQIDETSFRKQRFSPLIASKIRGQAYDARGIHPSIRDFGIRDLTLFNTANEAYHHLVYDLVRAQVFSTSLVLQAGKTKKIFVDGGFSRNEVFMQMLALQYPEIEVYASTLAQASAAGAALAIHHVWNERQIPADVASLRLIQPQPGA